MIKDYNILWIPMLPPYDNVNHAGGKTVNFYTKRIACEKNIKLTLLSICNDSQLSIVGKEFRKVNANCRLIKLWNSGCKKIIRQLINIESKFNPFNSTGGILDNWSSYVIKREIRKMASEGYSPDVVILQWTQMVLLSDAIRIIFPKSKIIAWEADVAFQGYDRHATMSKGIFAKCIWNKRAKTLKKKELNSLRMASMAVVECDKDKKLLEEESLTTPILVMTSFYQSLNSCERDKDLTHDILFYGAMYREENWKSALWFIDEVMPMIDDKTVVFKIIGGRPPQKLKDKESDNVKVLGFVEDISPLFSRSLCLVVPLVLGAGIKVKVLEGMSSGIPVLTNDIGIEGINANDGEDYFHCTEPEDYVMVINKLINKEIDTNSVCKKSKQFIIDNFDMENSYKTFYKELRNLCID